MWCIWWREIDLWVCFGARSRLAGAVGAYVGALAGDADLALWKRWWVDPGRVPFRVALPNR